MNGMAALAAGVCMVAFATTAQAQVRSFDVPAGNLRSALDAFGRQSGKPIIYKVDEVRGLRSNGYRGTGELHTALNAILAGTGFSARVGSTGAFAIVKTGNANGSGASPPSEEANAENAAATDENAEVVVTGSRIARTQYNSPSPVAVTTEEDVVRSGDGRIFDVLQKMPQFGVGGGATNLQSAVSEVGGQFVNLRGLGAERTLVLIDGQRRVSGATAASAVDLSSIPANMVARTEVVTGGAAAVYGADAVSGVVNVILREDVDGIELSTRQGISSRGDAYSYSYGGLLGGKLGDRGKFTLGVSYNHDDRLSQKDRSWSRSNAWFGPNPADTGPNDGIFDNKLYSNFRVPALSYSGTFDIGGNLYTYDGGVRPINVGSGYIPGLEGFISYGGGDGYNDVDWYALSTETSSLAAMAHVRYDLTDRIRLITDFQLAQSTGLAPGEPNCCQNTIVGFDNPFLPADVRALMVANGVSQIAVTRIDADQGPAFVNDSTRTTYTGMARLEGDLGRSLHWNAFAQYGRYDVKKLVRNMRIAARYAEARDATTDPATGRPVCRINVDADSTNDNLACRPVNLFGPNAIASTPDAPAYYRHDVLSTGTNTQAVFGAQMSGDLLALPGGSLRFVTGVEYRRETLATEADGLASTGQISYYSISPQSGEISVKEVFGEMSVPLLKDLPFANYLEADGAIRYSDYNTGIKSTTWKLGAVYAPVPDIRFRFTRSHSVRAPNVIELFSAGISRPAFYTDPCDASRVNASADRVANCRALGIPDGWTDPDPFVAKPLLTTGNRKLNPETANSLTFGAVLEPRFLPGLILSIDYWDMKIDDVISQPGVDAILNGCVEGPKVNDTLCGLVTRGPDHAVASLLNTYANFSSFAEKGIDFGLDYNRGVGNIGGKPLRLGVALNGAYIIKKSFTFDPNQPENTTIEAGTTEAPRFRGNFTTTATLGEFSIAWNAAYITRSVWNRKSNKDADVDNVQPQRLYNDLYVTANVTDRLRLGLGVNNIFDVIPPGVRPVKGGLYDVVGRRFFLTANLKM